MAHRIAQYKALHIRENVQNTPLSKQQADEVLGQWAQQAIHAPRIQAAPDLESFGLQLICTQRLALGQNLILQWAYLSAQEKTTRLIRHCGLNYS